jgi:hypothetical protein
MPPLPDSILGLFPPLGVSGVSHDSPAGIHPFGRRVTRPFRTPDNAYDTLSVQCIGADCDPEPPLVKAEMWFMNSCVPVCVASCQLGRPNITIIRYCQYRIANPCLPLDRDCPLIPRLPLVNAPL